MPIGGSKTRRIELRDVVRREREIRGPSETFHLRDAGGACDRRSDALARHEPSQRDLRRFGLMPGRNFIERLENIQTAFIEIFGGTFAACALSQVGL